MGHCPPSNTDRHDHKYGEPFVVKEAMRIDDIVAMPVRSL